MSSLCGNERGGEVCARTGPGLEELLPLCVFSDDLDELVAEESCHIGFLVTRRYGGDKVMFLFKNISQPDLKRM